VPGALARKATHGLDGQHQDVDRASGVVSGTTVRALVLGRFTQKKLKLELKDNAKNE